VAQQILLALKDKMGLQIKTNAHPVVLCSPLVRPYFRRLTERFAPNLVVLSHNEVAPEVWIESLGMVGLDDAN